MSEFYGIRKGEERQNESPCRISRRSIMPLLRYGDFYIFQDGGRHHLGFSKCENLRGRKGQKGRNASLSNFVAIGQIVAEIWRYCDFVHLAPKMVAK